MSTGWLVSVTLLALILGTLSYYTIQRADGKSGVQSYSQLTPPHANLLADQPQGILVPATGAGAAQPADGVPHVVILFDYQDATSALVAGMFSDALNALSARDEIVLEYRAITLNDRGRVDGASQRAAVAAACADTQDALAAYHYQVFAAQSGSGFTDEQLRSQFAKDAGLRGAALDSMQRCYDLRLTEVFVQQVDAAATSYLSEHNTRSIPAFFVNDTALDWQYLPLTAGIVSESTLRNAITTLVGR
ncbi:MAG: hypothetical protein LBM94_00200 [Propionibacteriaceae bacterium]|nr:hypothetical protein [Propionibacteriaceae bacterium]